MLRAVIDDGALIYLNDAEIFRVGVTNNPVYATNLAARVRGTADEDSLEGPLTVPANFATGDNLLAVELHQLNFIDAFFGAELNVVAKSFPNEPVRIVRQPADVFVREGEPFTFEVDSLAATNAQWFKEGAAIAGATAEILSLPRATLAYQGARFSPALTISVADVFRR
jgi:hypothetical protein